MKHLNTGSEVTITKSQTNDDDSLVDVIKPRNNGKYHLVCYSATSRSEDISQNLCRYFQTHTLLTF